MIRLLAAMLAATLALALVSTSSPEEAWAADGDPRVLVFTRTRGFVHDSIPHAASVIRQLGDMDRYDVVVSNDAGRFTAEQLAGFRAVVFLMTTGDVLNDSQQAAFEQYIRSGGGFVGVHAAAHTEFDWPWYGRLLGAFFQSHAGDPEPATVRVETRAHPSTASLPDPWVRTDEWYNFRTNPRGDVQVLLTLDESTFDGGTMGADHPIAWCQHFEGGRSWFTAGGHGAENYDEPDFRTHLRHGIRWAAGLASGDCDPNADPQPPPTPPGQPPVEPPAPGGKGRFVPVPPTRLLDTRTGEGAAAPGALPADGVLDVPIGGRAGVPADALAVAVNLTATNAAAAGYVTAWPTGAPRPTASNLNLAGPGHTAATFATVALGAGGRLSLYTQGGADLVADVTGYWEASGATRAGRFVAVNPARVLDTRDGNGVVAGALDDEGERRVEVAGRGGVPATGATAVVLNVTATGTTGPGYVAVWPDGPRPLVSTLNVATAGQTIANLATVPLGADGAVRLFTQTGTHLVADVAGWFTGPGAARSDDGLFVPHNPTRFLDTRTTPPTGVYGAASLLGGQRADLAVAGRAPVPATDVAAVVATVTATNTTAPGFVTVHPAATVLPNASNLNVNGPGETVPNLAVARLGHQGRVSLLAQSDLDLVVDVAGYFTGPAAPAEPGVSLVP